MYIHIQTLTFVFRLIEKKESFMMRLRSFPNSRFVCGSRRVLMEDRDEYMFDYQIELLFQEYQEEF